MQLIKHLFERGLLRPRGFVIVVDCGEIETSFKKSEKKKELERKAHRKRSQEKRN